MKGGQPGAQITCNAEEPLAASEGAERFKRPIKQFLGQIDLPIIAFERSVNPSDVFHRVLDQTKDRRELVKKSGNGWWRYQN